MKFYFTKVNKSCKQTANRGNNFTNNLSKPPIKKYASVDDKYNKDLFSLYTSSSSAS